jgi:tetratricopeptide (TPR) repeat protein
MAELTGIEGFVFMSRDIVIIALFLAVSSVAYFIFTGGAEPTQPDFQHPDVGGLPINENFNMDQLLADLPESYEELVNLGNRFMDNRAYAIAAECYSRAIAIDSLQPDVLVDLGACYHALRQPEKAIKEFERALLIQPDHAIAHFNMGVALSDLNQVDRAVEFWKRFIELAPDSPLADTIGSIIEHMQ